MAESRAREPHQGVHAHREPSEGQSRPSRHSRLQAVPGAQASRQLDTLRTPAGAAVPTNTLAGYGSVRSIGCADCHLTADESYGALV